MIGNGAAGASYGDVLVTSLIVLGAVCIAAFVAVRFFGRFLATGRARGTHLLDVVARMPLEPRRSLYVVEVAGKTLLVGTSEMGLSVLSELDAAEVKARVVPSQSFADLVRGAWQKRRGLGASAADVPAETRNRTSDGRGAVDVPAETRGRASAGQGAADVPAETRGRASDGQGAVDVPAETRGRASDGRDAADVPAATRGRASDGRDAADVPAEPREPSGNAQPAGEAGGGAGEAASSRS
jgi:flagellar protein FliO/FliZ